MNIIEVELLHTNPSMGPHETKTSYTLPIKNFQAQLKKLLEQTTVNSKIQLGEYLKILDSKDYDKLKQINDSFNPGALNSGAIISKLIFTKDDGSKLTLNDLRCVDLKGYYQTEFLKIIVNSGSKYVSTPMSFHDDHDNLIIRTSTTEDNSISESTEYTDLKNTKNKP